MWDVFIQEAALKFDRFYLILWLMALGLPASPVQQGLCAIDHIDIHKPSILAELGAGFHFSNASGAFGRASEYSLIDDGPTYTGLVDIYKNKRHLSFDLTHADEHDYQGTFHFDYQGLMRIDGYSLGFSHNLDHLLLPDSPLVNPDNGRVLIQPEDVNPSDVYRVDIHESGVKARGKIRSFPAHVNLAYWRLERTGTRQMHYVDENCTSCHLVSRSRNISRVTEEISGTLDAHLGWFDLIFEQVFRQFNEREAVPTDAFGRHVNRLAGDYQHDETPDSSFRSSTAKIHTSLTGGLVGALSHTLGHRENSSDLSDVRPVEAETDFHKTSGDLSYTPNDRWNINFRFRLLDVDNSNVARLSADGQVAVDPINSSLNSVRPYQDVRNSVDIRRGEYAAGVSYRPLKALTLKGDLRLVQIERGQTGGFVEGDFSYTANPVVIDPVWELPASENITTFKGSFFSRLFRANQLKLNGWYQISQSSDPAYGTAFRDSHEAFLNANWSPSTLWGISAGGRARFESNDRFGLFEESPGGAHIRYDLDRSVQNQSFNASGWFRPAEPLLLSLNYGFSRNRILQDLMFGEDPVLDEPIVDTDTEYSQRTQNLSANAELQILKNLKGLVEARYVKSFARFTPGFFRTTDLGSGPIPLDSSSLSDISELDVAQYGFTLGVDWNPGTLWTCAIRYSFNEYEDKNTVSLDGRVQSGNLLVSRKW